MFHYAMFLFGDESFQMNGSMVSGIQLKVSLARRQPVIEPINDASSSATWSTIGMHRLYSYLTEIPF